MKIKSGQRIAWQGKHWFLSADTEVAPAPAPSQQNVDGWCSMTQTGIGPLPVTATGEIENRSLLELLACNGKALVGKYDPMLNRFIDAKGTPLPQQLFQAWRYPLRAPKVSRRRSGSAPKQTAPAGAATVR